MRHCARAKGLALVLWVAGCAGGSQLAPDQPQEPTPEPSRPASPAAAGSGAQNPPANPAAPLAQPPAAAGSKAPEPMMMGKPAGSEASASGDDEPMGEPPTDPPTDPKPVAQQSPSAVYSAERVVGGLDHLFITKRDIERGYCVLVHLIAPSGGAAGTEAVELPPPWKVGQISAFDRPELCGPPGSVGGTGVTPQQSLSATGKIAFPKVGPHDQPCSIDIDLEATFTAAGPIPASDHLLAENISVACE